ncbi:MAG: aryl-sulfate sulfotransferase [Bacteroidetes bacterium]|nr:aryl-sulfate sulfotransferase [Bacteroidota bacterium]
MNRIFLKLLLLFTMISGVNIQAGSYGDYTFYSPKSGKAYLVDLIGNTYHTWTFSASAPTGYSSYLLPGGVVLRTVARSGNSFTGGPICGQVQKVDWNGNVIWDFVYSTTTYCTHHDIHPMPNGNVLLISYELKTAAEVSAAGCSQSITMWPDKIVEIQPSGATGGIVVWEWHAWDHLCQSLYPAKSNYVTSVVEHPGLLNINYKTTKDWMHVNGIDYNEALDQITFSSHNMNELYVIDHSTTTAEAAGHTGGNSGKGGDFLYRWGNPSAYQASGTTIFNVVHNAHWVPMDCPRANSLVGFNNKGGSGNKTCIDIINPPYNGYNYSITPGTAYEPPSYTWRHTYSGTPTQNEGHSQQLPNGNTLITMSLSGYIYEIDSNQAVVWSKTISGTVTNARRYTSCYVNGVPATPVITISGDSLMSSSTVGNQWFVNGGLISGATGRYLEISVPGSYQVQVTDGAGCQSPMSDPFVFVGIGEAADGIAGTVYPNPTTGFIRISSTGLENRLFETRVCNMLGKVVFSSNNNYLLDLSGLHEGIYYLSVVTNRSESFSKKIILIK